MGDNKITVDVELAIAQAQRDILKMQQQLTLFGVDVSKAFGQADKGLTIFKGSLAALQVDKLIEKGKEALHRLFEIFVTEGIAASSAYEDSLTSLNISLQLHGHYTTQASQAMELYAASIQATTKYSDDAALSAASLIEEISGLDEKGLKKATTSAINLAAAMAGKGLSLETAATLVGKAAVGEVGALSKYGIVVDTTGTKAQQAARALELLSTRFSGAAAAQVNTYSGAMTQMGHAFEDVQKNAGNVITSNPTLIKAFQLISEKLLTTADWLKNNKQAASDFVSQGLLFMAKGIGVTLVSLEVLYQSLALIGNSLAYVYNETNAVGNALKLNFKDAGIWSERASKNLVDIGKNLGVVKEQSGGSIFGKAAQEVADMIVQLEGLSKIQETVLNPPEKPGANPAVQRELDKRRSFLDTLLFYGDIQKAQTDIEDVNREMGLRKDATAAQQKLAISQLTADEQVKMSKKLVDAQNKLEETRVTTYKGYLGKIATLMTSHNTTLFYIGKAAAIAQATIDGVLSVTHALKDFGYPYNLVVAGLMGAVAVNNVAQIASQNPSFAGGGIMPGTDYSGDNRTANVNSGEMFVNTTQQAALWEFIAGGSRGGASSMIINFLGDVVVDSQARLDSLIDGINRRVKGGGVPLLATRLV